MTSLLRRTALALTLLLPAAGAAHAQGSGAGAEVLTNESVISMFTAKVPKSLIVTKVQNTKSNFDITPSGLLQLNSGKVPDDVIRMMMAAADKAPGATKESLDNDDVIKMVAGGLSKDVILAKVQMSKPNYDLTANGLIDLNKNKVSQDVVKAMMAAGNTGH